MNTKITTVGHHLDISEAIAFCDFITKGNPSLGLLAKVMISTGFRIGDALSFTHEMIKSGRYEIREQKTGKPKMDAFNSDFISDYRKNHTGSGYIFANRYGVPVSVSYTERMLKNYWMLFSRTRHVNYPPQYNFCSHVLRKTYAWHLFTSEVRSKNLGEPASLSRLHKVSVLMNHESIATTSKYLRITADECSQLVKESFSNNNKNTKNVKKNHKKTFLPE